LGVNPSTLDARLKAILQEAPAPALYEVVRHGTPHFASTLKAAVAVGVRAFSGTATTDPELAINWMLGPELAERWDDPARTKHVRWVIL